MYVIYPHGGCKNASSEGVPQAKSYQRHLELYNTVVSQLLGSPFCFLLVPNLFSENISLQF